MNFLRRIAPGMYDIYVAATDVMPAVAVGQVKTYASHITIQAFFLEPESDGDHPVIADVSGATLPQVMEAFKQGAFSARPVRCSNCGSAPMGPGCYHICHNSTYYYTPEQERQDEANYDPSEYYREGGFADPDYHPEESQPINRRES